MLFNYTYLKNYIDFKLSPEDLAVKLTMAGIETKVIDKENRILEAEVTPNRHDCLSYIGLAREIRALEGGKIKYPSYKLNENKTGIKDFVSISVNDKKSCPRYMARIITGIKVTESPKWLKDFLEKQGMRPVNNIVDVTNFILMEYGQPLHAFDFNKIGSGRIVVRPAKQGEIIVTIDGQKHNLEKSMLVIADGEKPQAVAGIMGGLDSEVTSKTVCILLESAFFNPAGIYRTSQKLNLKTDSSYRFERGVDWEGVETALDRASALIQEIAGGEAAKGKIDLKQKKFVPVRIKLRIDRLNDVLGTEITLTETEKILQRLGLETKKTKDCLEVKISSNRADLTREIDLIEEVARIYGYNKIKESIPSRPFFSEEDDEEWLIERKIKRILTSCGMWEVISYPFCYNRDLENLKKNTSCEMIRLTNPIAIGQDILRQTILPSFMKLAVENANFKNFNLKMFEVSNVFVPKGKSDLPEERKIIAGLITGFNQEKSWSESNRLVDFYDLKGILETLFRELDVKNCNFKQENDCTFHPKKASGIYVDGKKIGVFGELHSEITEKNKLAYPVCAFEIEWQKLLAVISKGKKYIPMPKFPGINRDIAFMISREVQYDKILSLIKKTGGSLIESVNIFDIYSGEQIIKGFQSMAVSIFYRNPERTLTDSEAESVHNKIKASLIENFDVKIR